MCASCKSVYKDLGYSLSGKRLASHSPKPRHQCSSCLKKNSVLTPGELCKDCLSGRAARLKDPVTVKAKGFLGPLLCLGAWAFMLVAAASGGRIDSGLVCLFGVLGVIGLCFFASSSEHEIHKNKSIQDEAVQLHGEEIADLERVVGLRTHSGKGSEEFGEYFVYLHYHPSEKRVVYVGKGKSQRDQSEVRTVPEHASLLKTGSLKVHRILCEVSEDVALEQESYLIGLFGRKSAGGQLFNVQGGVSAARNHLLEFSHSSASPSKSVPTKHGADLLDCLEGYSEHMLTNEISEEYRSKKRQQVQSIANEAGWLVVTDMNLTQMNEILIGRNVSLKTMSKYRSSFSSFCSWLVSQEKLGVNPFKQS